MISLTKLYITLKNILRLLFSKVFDKQLWLIAIFILGFALRIIGTNPGYLNHPDEPKIADAALNITFHLNFEPVAFYYGSLLPIVYALINFIFVLPIYILFYIPVNFVVSLVQGNSSLLECIIKTDFTSCTLTQSKEFYLYLTRYETAFLSSVTIILIYYLGKRLFNKQIGLLAAFFTAFNYRHVLSSHFSLADAPLTIFIIISILLSLKIIEKPSLKNYLWAGIGLGLTFSVKYFVYTIPVLVLCHIFGNWKPTNFLTNVKILVINYKIYLAFIIAIFTFFIINPYLLINTDSLKEQYALHVMFYGVSNLSWNNFLSLDRIPTFPVYYLFKYGLGEFISIVSVIGWLIALIKYPRSTIILSSVIIPFFYFFLIISATTYVRNFASILPLVTIFSAICIVQICRIFTKKIIVALIIALLINIFTLQETFTTSYGFGKISNYKILENWILEELPENSKITKTWGTPFPGRKQVDLTEWSPYPTSYLSLTELNQAKTEWLIIGTESGVYINHFLNISSHNKILYDSIISPSRFWEFLEDNYMSLITQELASYRIKEFIKPFPALDPSFIVIKIPPIIKYDMTPVVIKLSTDQQNSLCYKAQNINDNKLAINSSQFQLPDLSASKLVISSTPAVENKFYQFTTNVTQKKPNIESFRSSFVRMDFYSTHNTLIKTYVSNQIRHNNDSKLLQVSGIAPKKAAYLKLSFQIDECSNHSTTYLLENPNLSVSTKNVTVDLNTYPYYYQELSKSFIWLPPL